MKKIFLLASAASLLFAGCAKNEIDAPKTVTEDAPEYISASISGGTKVHLDGLKTSWHSSDRISLFAKSDAMHYYAFDALAEDEKSASFKYAGPGTAGTVQLDKNYCIYPDRGVTNGASDNTANAEGILTTRIIYNQGYSASNLLDHAPMVAVSDNYEFDFINVASVLRFNVRKSDDFTETCTLEKIGLSSASEYLSGTVSVDTKEENPVAVCEGAAKNRDVYISNINVEITTEAKPFCLVVFPATFPANDLTITLYYNDGSMKTVKYPSELTLGAGKVQDVNCTIKPEVAEEQDGVTVTTGGIFEFNGLPHLSCYTASVEGTVTGEGVTEIGVIYQRIGSGSDAVALQSAQLTYENVGKIGGSTNESNATNNIGFTKAASTDVGGQLVKLTNLAGGDGTSNYIYRYYAIKDDNPVYGTVRQFKTERYGLFVSVPAGTFTMGTSDASLGYIADYKTSPEHQVTLTKGFEIGKYEVSAKEFAEFLNAIKGSAAITESPLSVEYEGMNVYRTGTTAVNSNGVTYTNGTFKEANKKKPITGVTYIGAVKYCEWLSAKDATYDYRLPTEAEWEWAAMGADKSKGYKYCGSDILSEVGQCKGTSNAMGLSGALYPNELGIYDMSGNAWEFVADRSDYNWLDANGVSASYYEYCKDGVTDPTGPEGIDSYSFKDNTFYAIRKGGSTNDTATNNFCPAYRRTDNNGKQSYQSHLGFRIVRVPKSE